MNRLKIVCIDVTDGNSDSFTIGKIYESIIIADDYNPTSNFVINNNGDIQWIDASYFITLSEHRMNQLKKLGL